MTDPFCATADPPPHPQPDALRCWYCGNLVDAEHCERIDVADFRPRLACLLSKCLRAGVRDQRDFIKELRQATGLA